MNRKFLVTLLNKDIHELELITEGFMEMNEYPKAIIQLVQQKIDDLQSYIQQLSEFKAENEEATEIMSFVNEDVELDTALTPEIIEEKETINETLIIDNLKFEEIIVEENTTEEIIDVLELPENKVDVESAESIEAIDIVENEIIEETEITEIDEEPKKSFLEQINTSTTQSRNELLAKVENTLSSSLANKKITDIKQAINIGDRFRFQRELFRGNGEDMNKTLNYINQLATIEEVLSFLQLKYGWAAEHETAEDFYQIVRRRFL
ncbi:MAG: hypothetical protein ACOYMD_07265 [Paludibacter sp.]